MSCLFWERPSALMSRRMGYITRAELRASRTVISFANAGRVVAKERRMVGAAPPSLARLLRALAPIIAVIATTSGRNKIAVKPVRRLPTVTVSTSGRSTARSAAALVLEAGEIGRRGGSRGRERGGSS